MIIESTIGVAASTDLISPGHFDVYVNTGWGSDLPNRLFNNYSFGTDFYPELAGFFIKEFSTDIDGNTVPTNIQTSIVRGLNIDQYPRTASNATGSMVCRMSPFAMYNIYNPLTLTFANLESWVFNNTEQNEKFSPIDYAYSTSSTDFADNVGPRSAVSGPTSVSAFTSSGDASIGLEGITAIGVMCEVVSATNLEKDLNQFMFIPNGGSVANNGFWYIPA